MEPGERLEDVIVCRLVGGGLVGFLAFVAYLVDGEPRGLAVWNPSAARRAGEPRTCALAILVYQAFVQCARVVFKYLRVLCSLQFRFVRTTTPLELQCRPCLCHLTRWMS